MTEKHFDAQLDKETWHALHIIQGKINDLQKEMDSLINSTPRIKVFRRDLENKKITDVEWRNVWYGFQEPEVDRDTLAVSALVLEDGTRLEFTAADTGEFVMLDVVTPNKGR